MEHCQMCNRAIRHVYVWQGQRLGIECFKRVNPYDIDPAQAVHSVAVECLNGNKSGLSTLPDAWYLLGNEYWQREAKAHSQCFDGSVSWNLALLVRNQLARIGFKVFGIEELYRFK